MYYPARPPAKPWRISRNYANFIPDKMTSEFPDRWVKYRRACEMRTTGNDKPMRREQRKQQRRLNRYLCRLDTPEWSE